MAYYVASSFHPKHYIGANETYLYVITISNKKSYMKGYHLLSTRAIVKEVFSLVDPFVEVTLQIKG